MATAMSSLPLQTSSLSFDQTSNQLKTEKFFAHEDESEISTWFKMENESLPGVGLGSNGASETSVFNFASASNPFSFPHSVNGTDNPTTYFPFSYMSGSVPRSALPAPHDGEGTPNPPQNQQLFNADFPSFGSFGFTPMLSTNVTQNASSSSQMPHPNANQSSAPQFVNPQQLQIPTLQQHSIHLSSPFPSPGSAQYGSQFASQLNPSTFSQGGQFSLPMSQQVPVQTMPSVPQAHQMPQVTTQLGPQLQQLSNTLSNILQSTMSNPNLVTFQQQHLVPLYQLFSQFQQLFKTQMPLVNSTSQQLDDLNDDKKKKAARPFVKRVRQTRPKVVEAKGAVQCKGRNRKKGTQCRNAALMEYIGPRPIYCAEHIELDPKSLYEKCKSTYQKDPCDNKGCKEVVLKEFGYCYKHYSDLLNELVLQHDYERIVKHQTRIGELLNQLEREAAAAKKKDGDLYQRKNKLIPKFQEMKRLVSKVIDAFRINPGGSMQNIGSDDSLVCDPNAKKDDSDLPDDLVNDLNSERNGAISPILSLSEEESILGSESSSDSEFSEVDTVC